MSRLRDHAFDWIAWLLFAAVPLLIFWQSATSLSEQDAASGGPLENAALYPRIVATAMGIIVVIQLVRLILGRVQHHSGFSSQEGTRLALALTVLFIFYLLALPHAGFHIATPVLCIVMMWAFGAPAIYAVLGGTALWLGASYVFEGLLNVVLPVGIFDLVIFR